ncbi:MAG TPA: deaminase [Patescibacteria group bacterium]|nr:deaminase [Patescibacteria group bacterium]
MGQQKTDTVVKVEYPYIHPEGSIDYVRLDNKYMANAKKVAKEHSLDEAMPTGSVIIKDGRMIGYGANGSDYHKNNICERVRLNIPTGQGYDLCEGCHHKNHSEVSAIRQAKVDGNAKDLSGAALYLWGHWWCCEPCWSAMIENGISKIFLLKDSEVLFNKAHPDNVVGKQFV